MRQHDGGTPYLRVGTPNVFIVLVSLTVRRPAVGARRSLGGSSASAVVRLSFGCIERIRHNSDPPHTKRISPPTHYAGYLPAAVRSSNDTSIINCPSASPSIKWQQQSPHPLYQPLSNHHFPLPRLLPNYH